MTERDYAIRSFKEITLKRVDKTGNPQYKMIFFFFWMFL